MFTPRKLSAISITLLFVGLVAFAIQASASLAPIRHYPPIPACECCEETGGEDLLDLEVPSQRMLGFYEGASLLLAERPHSPKPDQGAVPQILSRGPPVLLL